MTHEEANDILNRFMGWEPKGGTGANTYVKGWGYIVEAPFDYFADTSEARERVRLLKDEFVQRTILTAAVYSSRTDADERLLYRAEIFKEGVLQNTTNWMDIESHAIAFAIAAALKEQ